MQKYTIINHDNRRSHLYFNTEMRGDFAETMNGFLDALGVNPANFLSNVNLGEVSPAIQLVTMQPGRWRSIY